MTDTPVRPVADAAQPWGDAAPGLPRRGWAALAGLAAGAVTLGAGALVAALVSPTSSPLVAVGGAFVDATPLWLKDLAVRLFGTADKLALTIGMFVVLGALAALAGVLAARRWAWGAALVVVLGVVGAVAAVTRPDAGAFAALPSLVGAAVGLLTLHGLLRVLRGDRSGDTPTGPDRRRFLTFAGLAVAGAAVAAVAGRALATARTAVETARSAVVLPNAVRLVPDAPATAQSPVPGTVPVVTPNRDFYRIDTALVVPRVDPSTWSLRVHGLVEREVTLTWDELLEADLVEAWVTLTCVSNEVGGDLAGNARWLGLPVREVLARAVPSPDADMVLSTSADGWTASTPLEVLTDPDRDALLAVGMNGEPLPLEHGFPVRMVVPGLYGYVSATKWVVDLEVTRFADQTAYWTDRGWSPRGPVKTASRIEVPRRAEPVAAGSVAVGGTAWAQHRGITAVQVRVDAGEWHDATLADEIGIDTWRQWSWTWQDATPGKHTLDVRASDPDGFQTGEVAGVVPDGATGYHRLHVTVT